MISKPLTKAISDHAWSNYYLKRKDSVPWVRPLNFKELEPRHEWDYLSDQPLICEVFGCGQLLTIREQLFGNKCIIHSGK